MLTMMALLVLQTADETHVMLQRKKLAQFDKKLTDDPTDPEANLKIGSFLCFYANDWVSGLQNLELVADSKLADHAKSERSGTVSMEMADYWWDLGIKKSDREKTNITLHAASLYSKLYKELQGKEKTKAYARFIQAQKNRGVVKLTVNSKDKWTDTGVDLIEGQTVQLTATGKWTWDGTRDANTWSEHDGTVTRLKNLPAAGDNIMALIGRAGDQPPVAVKGLVFKASQSGRFYLGPNDFKTDDNDGMMVVTITTK